MYAIIATGGKQYKVSEGDIIDIEKIEGKKVVVYHYKRKTGYHKKNGHRQLYTRVKIDKING